jgi:hypothetical protein
VALTAAAITFTSIYLAAGALTPLLVVYREQWAFPASLLTLAFAVYAIGFLAALLTLGSLSDHIGRRPVLTGALVVQLASNVMFLVASGVGWVIAGRIVQGVAGGAATTAFTAALVELCHDLARQLQADAEGASHDIAIEVVGAASEDDAVTVGRAVARSNLFKAAVFGNDPNWGRVLAAIGTTDATFDPYEVDVAMNGVRVCSAGGPDRPRTEVDLRPRDVHVLIDLHAGGASATILTNDLTHDYVHENSAYAS